MKDLYEIEENKYWTGSVSQCFSCANRKCLRRIFKKNNLKGIEEAPGNPGVILSKKFCKNWKDKYGTR